MATLKELRKRIRTVGGVRKITAVMRLVASARLKKAQRRTEHLRRYREALRKMAGALPGGIPADAPTGPTAVVIQGAERGMCGAYDANLIRKVLKQWRQWEAEGIQPGICYVSGHKVAAALRRDGLPAEPRLPDRNELAGYIRIVVFSTRAESLARQRVLETVLPETPTVQEPERWYVYEPYIDAIRCRIRPALMDVDLRLLAAEAAEAELAARMIAMQGATDNADELLHELNLSYNRIRQQLVTNELQDISGTRTGLNK